MTDVEPYGDQDRRLPAERRAIVASFDEATIVVYQAYGQAIAQWAVEHQRLGGPHFRFTRMSWIKPSFLWMMYRSGWATKADQEHVLAIRVWRIAFDALFRSAVPAQYDSCFGSHGEWKRAVAASDVRVQWDPDRDPMGNPLARRAIQLGLRGYALRRLATHDIKSIKDVTAFVRGQGALIEQGRATEILVPHQDVYRPDHEAGTQGTCASS